MNSFSISIKTKPHDGGSYLADSSEAKVKSPSSSEKPDAFSVYSNQEIRMNRLLGRHELDPSISTNKDTGTSVAPTCTETHTTNAVLHRKTRLSFEVHPALLLEDHWSSPEE
jgi:hypothetical protein